MTYLSAVNDYSTNIVLISTKEWFFACVDISLTSG